MSFASKDPKPLSKIAVIDDTAIEKIVAKLPPISATLTPQQIADIAAQVDVSGKVDKVTGKSLVADLEIGKIHTAHSDDQDLRDYVQTDDSRLHASGSDNQDLSNLVVKITGSSLVADTEILKIHSNTLDHSHTNKNTLDSVQEALTTILKTSYDGAVTHAGSTHAPSDAQKNSNILKSEIEAVLTGELTSHSHASSGGLSQQQILRMI